MKNFTHNLSRFTKKERFHFNHFLFILLFSFIWQGTLFAQKPIDSLDIATNGTINTAVMNGEDLFIGGDFTFVGKKIGPVAFFHNGSTTPDYKKPLFGTMINSGFYSDWVETVCSDGKGGWFVGGYFRMTNNQEDFAKLVHINADNTPDPKLIINWKSVDDVYVLKKDGNFLYVGGRFTAVDEAGNEHKNVFRLNLNSYAIDAGWNPPIVNSYEVKKLEIGTNEIFLAGNIGKVDNFQQAALVVVDKTTGARITIPTTVEVTAMHIIGDTLLLAESDMYWSSYPDGYGYITKGVAVLDESNDSLSRYTANTDYYFLYSIPDGNGGWYAKGRLNGKDGLFHLNNKLEIIQNFSQDKLYPGGYKTPMLLHNNTLFDADATSQEGWVDIGNSVKARYLFKLDAATGSIDTLFTPNPNGRIYSMVMQGDTLFVGGKFDSIAGQPRDGLAALNASTGALLDWHPEVHLSNYLAGFSGGDRYFNTLKIADGYLYTGGKFQISTATLDSNGRGIYGLARFHLNTGVLDSTFHIYTRYYDQPNVTGMAFYSGKLFFVGYFTIKTPSGTVKDAGMVDIASKALQPVHPHLIFKGYSAFSQEPKVLVHNNKLYFNGMDVNDTVTNKYRQYTFCINTGNRELTSWNPAPNDRVLSLSFSGDNLLMTGAFYFLHHSGNNNLIGINIKTKQYIHFPNINTVHSIVSTDKYIFMGGDFTYYNDSVANGLFRLKRSDLSWTHFDHQIRNNNNRASIGDLALGEKGLYVVGLYHSSLNLVGGVPRQNICLLSTEDASLNSWNPPPFNGKVLRVFTHGTEVAFAGEFGLMPAFVKNGMAKINLKTGTLSDWNANVTFSSYSPKIFRLLVAGDTLFVGGGSVSKVNAKDAGNIFAVNTNSGSFIEGFAPPAPDDYVTALSKSGSNLYIGGDFEKIGNTNRFLIAKLDASNGTLKNWNANLDPSNNWASVNDILSNDTNVFIVGNNLRMTDSTVFAGLLRFDAADATLKKMYGRNEHSSYFTSIAQNATGKIAVGRPKGIYLNNPYGFYLYDEATDSLIPKNTAPAFKYGVVHIQALGDKFLVAGNRMKEFDFYTYKPGLYVYDPKEDTTIASFSTPVIDGDINTFVANEKLLAFAGNFGGMNGSLRNADLALMNTPELYLNPGVTSWSPHSANTADPFAVSVYGSGFTNQTTVFLYLSDKIVTPDSMSVSDRKLIAYFNGSDFSANSWNLKIQIAPEYTPLDFEKAIAIKKAEKTDVWIKWTGPDRVLVNRPTTYYLTYGNKGNKDAYGVILYLAVGANQTVIFPNNIAHPKVKFEVNWDTIPNYVDVDYFLGEPFHGKVYTLFIPYMPQQYNGGMKLKVTTEGAGTHDVRVAIGKPIYQNYDELFQSLKSTQGMAYNFFNCMYSVAGIVADLTPGLGCAKAAFDNSVLMAVDKYQKGESIKVEDIANSIGMTALGCVPGEAQLSTAFKIAKGMASMYGSASDAGSAMSACGSFANDCKKEFLDMMGYYSHDPNAKYGPSGRASSIFVSTHKDFQYMITYENDSAATAPAQRVIIIDTLDKNVFDIQSFIPVGFGFGDTAYFYQANDGDTVDIDMRPNKQIIVRVIHSLDKTSGILTWTFLTLDPDTYELVENIDDGFLPPNKKSPEGEGNVIYTITPLSGLPDSTMINNSAHIVFDWNQEIPTNRWHNTTDNTPPESAVKPLPEVTMEQSFKVHWGGKDQGSGIFSYTVFVAENDSAYYSWLPDTHDTVAVFTGKGGVTYKFYTVAVDSAGNKESTPVTYDAITRVSGTGVDNFGTENKLEIKIYPNPAKEKVTIESFMPEQGTMRIDILNTCGKVVTEHQTFTHLTGKSSLIINLHGLPAGIYFVRILTKKGVQIKKLIKH